MGREAILQGPIGAVGHPCFLSIPRGHADGEGGGGGELGGGGGQGGVERGGRRKRRERRSSSSKSLEQEPFALWESQPAFEDCLSE